jgi:hypothetical protein
MVEANQELVEELHRVEQAGFGVGGEQAVSPSSVRHLMAFLGKLVGRANVQAIAAEPDDVVLLVRVRLDRKSDRVPAAQGATPAAFRLLDLFGAPASSRD